MRKPAILHYGDTLPSATEFEEGDMFFLRSTGELYIRTGGAWSLSASGAVITSVNNDGTGTPLVSDTGTAHSAKVRSLSTSGNGITLAISTGGGEIELNFDKTAAGVGAPNGIASLDSSGRVVERLSYEGIPNGVPQLTAASEVAQPPSGQGFANLSSTDALAGEFFVAKSGVMYKTQGGYAGGPAILDTNGKIIDRLAYEGQASGVALLDAGGMPLTAASEPVVESGSNSNGNWVRLADGTQICWQTSAPSGLVASSAAVQTFTVYYANIAWTFPAPFVAAPAVSAIGDIVGTLAEMSYRSRNTTTTDTSIQVASLDNFTALHELHTIAIGRWK